LQGTAVKLADIDPWPDHVNGADVLDAIAERFTRYVALPDGAADVLALWCGHVHVFEVFQCSPRLNITSPEKQCGKTTLRDAISLFVQHPILTENLTTAVLFRLVDGQSPVMLADEYDCWLGYNEELRGLLNAGHRKGAMVYRCEGDNNEVRAFSAYAPAVLCGIGSFFERSYRRVTPSYWTFPGWTT
jgi:putative DNA primase/helicase